MSDAMNPHGELLLEARALFQANEAEYTRAERDLAWFRKFDPEAAHARLHTINREHRAIAELLQRKRWAQEKQSSEAAQLKNELPKIWDFRKSSLRATMLAQIEEAEKIGRMLEAEMAELRVSTPTLDEAIELGVALARYREFDLLAAEAKQQLIPAMQTRQQELIDQLQAKHERVEEALAPYRPELEEMQLEESRLLVELSRLQALAEAMNREDGNGRRLLHQQCEEQFGISSPSRGVGQWDRRLQTVRRHIGKQREVMMKASERAQNEVRNVVVDGSNLMYAGRRRDKQNFVGLRALDALVPELARRYQKVTLYVDFGDAKAVNMDEETLRRHFAQSTARVYVTRSREAADESILSSAESDPHTYVISGDIYNDHKKRFPFIVKRRLDPRVTLDHVMVHDLDIRLQLTGTASV